MEIEIIARQAPLRVRKQRYSLASTEYRRGAGAGRSLLSSRYDGRSARAQVELLLLQLLVYYLYGRKLPPALLHTTTPTPNLPAIANVAPCTRVVLVYCSAAHRSSPVGRCRCAMGRQQQASQQRDWPLAARSARRRALASLSIEPQHPRPLSWVGSSPDARWPVVCCSRGLVSNLDPRSIASPSRLTPSRHHLPPSLPQSQPPCSPERG